MTTRGKDLLSIVVLATLISVVVAGCRAMPWFVGWLSNHMGKSYTFAVLAAGAVLVAAIEIATHWIWTAFNKWAVPGWLGNRPAWARVCLVVSLLALTGTAAVLMTAEGERRSQSKLEEGVRTLTAAGWTESDRVVRPATDGGTLVLMLNGFRSAAVVGDDGVPKCIRLAMPAHAAELCGEFPADPAPTIVEAHLWDVLPGNAGPEIVAVLQHTNGMVGEVQVLNRDGRVLSDPSVWNVGRISTVCLERGSTPALWIAAESVTGFWGLPELAKWEEWWCSSERVAHYSVFVARLPLEARGLIGPMPPTWGPPALGIRTWFYCLGAGETPKDLTIVFSASDAGAPTVLAREGETRGPETEGARLFPVELAGLPAQPAARSVAAWDAAPILLADLDVTFPQAALSQSIAYMTYLDSPSELARMFRYVNERKLTSKWLERGLAVQSRLLECAPATNNFANVLAHFGSPCPRVCTALDERLAAMISSNRFSPTAVPRVWNTRGKLRALIADFPEAIACFEASLAGADPACARDSMAFVTVCAFHAGDSERRDRYARQLIALVNRQAGSGDGRDEPWVRYALSLANRPVPHPKPTSRDDPTRQVTCPARADGAGRALAALGERSNSHLVASDSSDDGQKEKKAAR